MAFLAGDLLTAQRANRLQPKFYNDEASGTLAASSTNVDVPGVSIAFTTETDGATVHCSWSSDFDLTGSTTTLGSTRLLLDGVTGSSTFATIQQGITTDRASVAQFCSFTIPTAGAHTIKMQGTTPANMIVNLYTALNIIVFEIV
jgi:hypothetical protein